MPTFEEQKSRYMLSGSSGSGSSASSSGGTSIPIFPNCEVLPLIGGRDYFPVLKAKIDSLGSAPIEGQFIYICGWWLAADFSLNGVGGPSLKDLLIAKARAGVDVRVLGWVMAPQVMQSSLVQADPGAKGMLSLNSWTMEFVNQLRSEPALAHKACLNILSHPAGAVHLKMALVGTTSQAIGFTGGLDLQSGRHNPNWHDVQAQVTGAVLQGLFDAFRNMWNEIRGRSPVHLSAPRLDSTGATVATITTDSHTSSMPTLAPRTISSTAGARMHAQSALTLPIFNFSTLSNLVMPSNTSLSYASSGLFQIKAIWEKGIKAAQTCIYIEDQGFYAQEVFDWVNATIKVNASLKVILVTGAADPNDDPANVSVNDKFFRIAVNQHLLNGLNSAQIDRIGIFSHRSRVIHAKTTIVDDQWAMIGSANCMRRSLYTDFEHSVAYMDEDGRAVPAYRTNLWRQHLQQAIPDLTTATAAWFAIPFIGGAPSSVPLNRLRLPLPSASLTSEEQLLYDQIHDADSRQAWGGALMTHYMSRYASGSMSP